MSDPIPIPSDLWCPFKNGPCIGKKCAVFRCDMLNLPDATSDYDFERYPVRIMWGCGLAGTSGKSHTPSWKVDWIARSKEEIEDYLFRFNKDCQQYEIDGDEIQEENT